MVLQRNCHQPVDRLVLAVLDAGGVKHSLGGPYGIGLCVFVRVIDDFGNTGLDESFGTFVTREQGGVDFGTSHVDAAIV